jgi:hypothetical protein
MDIREHSVTLVSVVIGLGLTELLGNLNRLIRARGKVRWHGLPVAWTLYVLLLVVTFWWGVYLGVLGITTPQNAFEFLLNLCSPLIVYLICSAALPDIDVERGVDLKAAYFSGARYFFGLTIAYILVTMVQVAVQSGGLEWSQLMAIRVGLVAAVLPLVWVRSERYHWCAAILVLALTAYRMTLQVLR